MLFTWFMLAGFIFLFAPQDFTGRFQVAFFRVFQMPLSIGENISLSVRTPRLLSDDTNVVPRREHDKLQNRCADLEAWLRQEHEKLEKLTQLRARLPLEGAALVDAGILSASFDKLHGEIIIDQGRDDGLEKGQFVLADYSIIGTITSVLTREARVKLFTNPTSNIAVNIDGTKWWMCGTGDNLAKIPMVRNTVKTDTEIMAARAPGFLDAPMIIGKVVRCERNSESAVLWDIIVKPACDIQHLNSVVVIVMNPQK